MRPIFKTASTAIVMSMVACVPIANAQEITMSYAILKVSDAYQMTGTIGDLLNCKGLTTKLVSDEVIAMVHCSSRADLTRALVSDIPASEGILAVDVVRMWGE